MTLIAGFKTRGEPALIGDLLVTNFASNVADFMDLPSVGDSREIFGDSGPSLRWGQKIALLNKYAALGWTGTRVVASSLVKDLRIALGDDPKSGSEFIECMERVIASEGAYAELGLIVLMADPSGAATLGHFNTPVISGLPEDEWATCAGMGADQFAITLLNSISVGREAPAWYDSLARSLMFYGAFLSREMRSLGGRLDFGTTNPLYLAFGAGYELAMPDGQGHIAKIDMTLVWWRVRLLPSSSTSDLWQIEPPSVAIRTAYYRNRMELRWGRVTAQGTIPWASQKCISVPDVADRDSSTLAVKREHWPALSSSVQAHILLIEDDVGPQIVSTYLETDFPNPHQFLLSFEESPAVSATLLYLRSDAVQAIDNHLRMAAETGALEHLRRPAPDG